MAKTARNFLTFILLSVAAPITGFAASQTIAFDAIPNQIFGWAPFVVVAEASSGLPVSFASTTPGVCKLAGSLVMVLSAGPCFITASQAGNGSYSAATPVTRSFAISQAGPAGTLTAAPSGPFGLDSIGVGLAVGDFNGDGILDIAVAEESAITIALGNGSGGFTAGTTININTVSGTAMQFSSIVAGDFNGDGFLDLAAASRSTVSNVTDGDVTVLLGNGAGGFTPAAGSPLAVGESPKSLVVGDFNGDGIEDLATANSWSNNVTVLLGNGLGGFAAAAGSPVPAGSSPSSLAVGDFNGDGIQDLAVADESLSAAGVTILLGNGSGGFTASPGSPFAGGGSPGFIVAGDFNGDGAEDVAVANAGGSTVTVLLGNGAGGLAAGSAFTAGFYPDAVTVGDFNGDGIPDLAIANGMSGVSVLLGNGRGGFTAVGNAGGLPAAGGFLVAGDFNGDGIQDLAVATYGSNVTVTVFLGSPLAAGAVLSTTSPAAIAPGQPVALTLTVSDPIEAFSAPTGTVTISDGSTVLGTASQTASPYSFTASNLAPGSHVFTAAYSGDARTSGSSSNAITIQVYQTQSITFAQPSGVSVGASPFALNASATSGLGVSFASTTSSVCTVTPTGTVTVLAAGTCSVTASQPGNADYSAATAVTQSFTVVSGPGYLLTIAVSPANSGSVTLSPASAGNYYASGSSVCLTASPAAGQIFTGWTGATLNAAGCLVITSNTSVAASFQANPITSSSALRFVPVAPCRLVDTRNSGPSLGAGSTRRFTIAGTCGIPSTALAYSLNLTVVPRGTLVYVTMWAAGQAQPAVSTLNSIDGRVKSNAAIVAAGSGGAVSVYATDSTDVILDINGYFDSDTDPGALVFYPLAPCRVADTRNAAGSLGGPSLAGGVSRSFPLTSTACNIPGFARAYSLNFTAIPKGSLGYLTVWPSGQSQPLVSTLNAPTGAVTANAAIVPAGTGGAIELFATDNTDMAIDINGYFAASDGEGLSLYALTPCRMEDTRLPAGAPAFTGTVTETVTGVACGVPPEARSLVLNATVVPSGGLGYLSLWGNGGSQPGVSTLNSLDGSVTSNMAVVPATNGLVNAYAAGPGATYLILDISGYFAP